MKTDYWFDLKKSAEKSLPSSHLYHLLLCPARRALSSAGSAKRPCPDPDRRRIYLIGVADVLEGGAADLPWESVPRDDSCEVKPNRRLVVG